VIGVITQKIGEGYRVDIGSAHFASLDGLAFEGATKRSRPNLKVGSYSRRIFNLTIYQVGCLVYARVSLAHKDMEPELECFDAQTRKAEGFGGLKGGFVVRCSLKMCREYVVFFVSVFANLSCLSKSARPQSLPFALPRSAISLRSCSRNEWSCMGEC
jgi:exosome complex RNA-binding protein Rrp4